MQQNAPLRRRSARPERLKRVCSFRMADCRLRRIAAVRVRGQLEAAGSCRKRCSPFVAARVLA
eukprot:3377560-Alexandrium_andersonii.AAC.1